MTNRHLISTKKDRALYFYNRLDNFTETSEKNIDSIEFLKAREDAYIAILLALLENPKDKELIDMANDLIHIAIETLEG